MNSLKDIINTYRLKSSEVSEIKGLITGRAQLNRDLSERGYFHISLVVEDTDQRHILCSPRLPTQIGPENVHYEIVGSAYAPGLLALDAAFNNKEGVTATSYPYEQGGYIFTQIKFAGGEEYRFFS